MRNSTVKKRKGENAVSLAIDIGTGGVRTLLLEAGTLTQIGKTGEGFFPTHETKISDTVTWIQQDPEDFLLAVSAAMQQIRDQGILKGKKVVSIGIVGQMHAGVLYDANHRSLCRASLWNCPRATAEGAELTKQFGEKIDRRLTISHLLWLQKNVPDLLDRAKGITTPAGFLGLALTGTNGLGYGEFSGLGVGDTKTGQISDERLAYLGNRNWRALLPDRIGPLGWLGTLTEKGAALLGLPSDNRAVVAAPEGDQPGGTLGLGVVEPNVDSSPTTLLLGTSCVLNMIARTTVQDQFGTNDLFRTFKGDPLNMGLVTNGMELQTRVASKYEGTGPGKFGVGKALLAELDRRARNVPANCGGNFRLDLLRSEAFLALPSEVFRAWTMPAEDNPAVEMKIAHITIAILLRRRLRTLFPDGNYPTEIILGGGGSNSEPLVQTVCSCLGIPIRCPATSGQASAFGAGMIAALAEENHSHSLDCSPAEFMASLAPQGGDVWQPIGSPDDYNYADEHLDEVVAAYQRK